MKKTPAFLMILLYTALAAGEIRIPQAGFIEGWSESGSPEKYFQNDLYGHINGGAELFLEFGFDSLVVQNYSNGDKEISLEIYFMETPESALGIYLMKCGRETPAQNLSVRNSANPYQILAVDDRCYVQINNFSGDKNCADVILRIAGQLFGAEKKSAHYGILDLLPQEKLIPGSEKLVRGPYALQPFYTFGEGDIFQLHGKIFAVTGVYRINADEKYGRMAASYPDSGRAAEAFINFRQNLDSYLSVIRASDNELVFRDYRNKYGQIIHSGKQLLVLINLPDPPP